MPLSAETREHLKRASTATLTTQLFKRGLRNVFIQGVRRMSASRDNLVGEAFTLRYIPAREDIDLVSAFEDPEHPQRKAIETVPPDHVLVMDCRRETRAASGGDILLTRLQGARRRRRRHRRRLARQRSHRGDGLSGLRRGRQRAAQSGLPSRGRYQRADRLRRRCGVSGRCDRRRWRRRRRHSAGISSRRSPRDAREQEIMEEFVLREIEQGRALPGTYPPNAETLARYRQWRERRDRE